MKTCKTCVYWAMSDEDYHKTNQGNNVGECSNSKFVYTGDGGNIDDDGVSYYDMESYNAMLHTGKDFGCIHHKQLNKEVEK